MIVTLPPTANRQPPTDYVVVVGGVSGIVVVLVPVDNPGFGPSLPVDGCGGASPLAPAEGVALSVAGGFVTSGGAF